jgi:DNA replication protein DnaC
MSEVAVGLRQWQPYGSIASLPHYLTEPEAAEVEHNPIYASVGGRCPNCLGTGVFQYDGEEWECADDDYSHVALRLFKRYCLSNVPAQYQRMDWSLFPHAKEKEEIGSYLDSFATARLSGAGWDIHGASLGVGKTWAATHLLKEIVKQGHHGWFIDFFELMSLHDQSAEAKETVKRKLNNARLLVVDDVRLPNTPKQQDFYAAKLEEVIRPRTNANLPTVTTTNLSEPEVAQTYPRVYSLLSAKQLRIELSGPDARLNEAYHSTRQLVARGEVAPIT